jgi:pectin methylesterase-like acyl-CoA thioesterase
MLQGGFIRLALFLVLGVFLWAGTVSIKYPQQTSTVTASSPQTCAGNSDGERLLEYLKMGTVTSIQDNGRILTIGLSPQWANLPVSLQQKTYATVACYAQSLHRPFQFLVNP